MSDEIIKLPDYSIAPRAKYTVERMYVKFNGSCLKQDKITFNHAKILNIYVVYGLKSNLNNFGPNIENCLFGTFKFLKNNDYVYDVGYGVGFGPKGSFSYPAGKIGQNLINFGADISYSVHSNNKRKNILILGESTTQLYSTILNAEKMYSINFTGAEKICLVLHYNGSDSYLFVNGIEIIKLEAEDSKIVANPVCSGNILENDLPAEGLKKTGLHSSVFDFSVDYRIIAVDNILDIHKY